MNLTVTVKPWTALDPAWAGLVLDTCDRAHEAVQGAVKAATNVEERDTWCDLDVAWGAAFTALCGDVSVWRVLPRLHRRPVIAHLRGLGQGLAALAKDALAKGEMHAARWRTDSASVLASAVAFLKEADRAA